MLPFAGAEPTLYRMCVTPENTSPPRPRLVIAGTHSGAGKTSVITAVLAALRARGVPLYPFKVGPDYIDPAFHARVTGVASRNLDSWLLDAKTLRALFFRNSGAEGVAVIEGVMGLFDGKGAGHAGSTAHVADLLAAPVVLVLDARGLSRSAAAMVAGYAGFHPGSTVRGVIVNRVKSARQYAIIKESVESACAVPCLGYLPENAAFALRSRHLGLVPSGEVTGLDDVVAALGNAAAAHCDLDGLLCLARSAPPLPAGGPPAPGASFPVRLGVARDEAFSFYYQDNFDLLRALGAQLVFFSPIRDPALPENIHGLYLGGGFPEMFASSLGANVAMRHEVRRAAAEGMPVYAECGGMIYLCAFLTDADGERHPMAGVFRREAAMTARLQHFGYAEALYARDTILGPAGTRVRTHEFHYSRLAGGAGEVADAYVMHKDGFPIRREGLVLPNVLAAYPHIHFYSNPALAASFLARCAAFREGA